MERSSDHHDLATALAEVRPAPRDAFVQDLDERVAAGFPRRSRVSRFPLAGWIGRSPMRLASVGAAVALASIVVATALIASSGSGSRPIAIDSGPTTSRPSVQGPAGTPQVAAPESSGRMQYSEVVPFAAVAGSSGSSRAVSPSAVHSSEAESGAEVN